VIEDSRARDIETLEWKLKKRGLVRDPVPISCEKCGVRAVFLYATKQTKIGQRTISWCHACHDERGWRRPGNGDRVEDAEFDLESFLG
jgi:hypothetical protein